MILALFAFSPIYAVSIFAADQPVLRVAADPNNLPFSNERSEGFENKIAEIIAHDLGAKLEYHWQAQRRGFFRQTLKEGRADLVVGVPTQFDMAATTQPYYRSTYVFVSRRDRDLNISSFDDAKLRNLKIGVQIVGADEMNTPPAHALAARGIINNVRGFTLYGDYETPNPPARIVDAVKSGEIDVAVVWGPLAGYFAKNSNVPLNVSVLQQQQDGPLRFAFDISAGVSKGNKELQAKVDRIIATHREDITRILDSYSVPRVEKQQTVTEK